MRHTVWLCILVPLLCITILASLSSSASPSPTAAIKVLTQHNDNSRTGANLAENILNTGNVNPAQFGWIFSRQVDGQVYAQPLYVPNVSIPGKGVHNVLYVATMHNSVYAFEADDPFAATPLWKISLEPSMPLPAPDADFGSRSYGSYNYKDIQVEIGIVSTPVIDDQTNTIYVVTFTYSSSNGYHHVLHALDITTGAEKFGGPVTIATAIPGTGYDSVNGVVTFNSKQEIQRAALLLANGTVYIAFASYADTDPYHGWILGYNASTLALSYIFNTTRYDEEGGIWQGGTGLSTDSNGNIYVAVGNGTFTTAHPAYGNTILKLSPHLDVLDWFTPYNQAFLASKDYDLGTTGVLMLPGTNLAIAGNKQGKLYMVDINNMGHYNPVDDSQIAQSFQATNRLFSSPIFWNGPNGPAMYIWGALDSLKEYRLSGGLFQTTPASQSVITAPAQMPGGMISLSANGGAAGSGIVWAVMPYTTMDWGGTAEGIVRAYNAENLGYELWNSKQGRGGPSFGFTKFCPPTIARGKVYVATTSNMINVYGIIRPFTQKLPLVERGAALGW